MPFASTKTWRLVPGLPRSVGFGPVSSPPFGRERGAVERAAAEVDRVRPAEPVQQRAAEPFEDPGRLPVAQPSPAGHTRTGAHSLGQARPGDAGAEHEDDALERLAVVQRRPAAPRARRSGGEQGRDQRPQRIGDERFSHPPRLTATASRGRFRYALLAAGMLRPMPVARSGPGRRGWRRAQVPCIVPETGRLAGNEYSAVETKRPISK